MRSNEELQKYSKTFALTKEDRERLITSKIISKDDYPFLIFHPMMNPSRILVSFDKFLEWYYSYDNPIDWEQREWDLSVKMLNTSVSVMLGVHLETIKQGIPPIDMSILQTAVSDFVSESTNEFLKSYKARYNNDNTENQ